MEGEVALLTFLTQRPKEKSAPLQTFLSVPLFHKENSGHGGRNNIRLPTFFSLVICSR